MYQNMFQVLPKNIEANLCPNWRMERMQCWAASSLKDWKIYEVEGKGFGFVASTHEVEEEKKNKKTWPAWQKEETIARPWQIL